MFPPPIAKTTARGYGKPHQNLRAQWAPKVAAGQVNCWRCGYPIQPGEAWDLGHDDDDPTKTRYRGPEHRHRTAHCKGNRLAGLIKAANNNKRKATAKTVSGRPSTAARWVTMATGLTAHALARILLDGPDQPVIGTQPGDDMGDYSAATDVEDVTDRTWWDADMKINKDPAVRIIFA